MPIEFTARIDPKQDYNGYSRPWGAGAGKNLFPGFTSTPQPALIFSDKCYVNFNENTNYVLSGLDSTHKSYIWAYDSEGGFVGRTLGGRYSRNLLEKSSFSSGGGTQDYDSINYLIVRYYDVDPETFTIDDANSFPTQLEIGDTATSYEPYANSCPITGSTEIKVFLESEYSSEATEKSTINWEDEAGSIYGGEYESNGKLTEYYVSVDISSLTWQFYQTGKLFRSNVSARLITTDDSIKIYSDNYLFQGYGTLTIISANIQNNKLMGQGTNGFIAVRDDRFIDDTLYPTNADKVNAFLAANIGTKVCYRKSSIIDEYTVEPCSIETVGEENAVWTDSGNISVTYQSTSDSYDDTLPYSFASPLGEYNDTNLHLFNDTFIENGMGD